MLTKRNEKSRKERLIGVVADVITKICTGITNFLLWVQKRGSK